MLNERELQELEAAAQYWDDLASETEQRMAYERSIGIQPDTKCAGDFKAETYRDTAKALRLEIATGIPHCVCCHKESEAS